MAGTSTRKKLCAPGRSPGAQTPEAPPLAVNRPVTGALTDAVPTSPPAAAAPVAARVRGLRKTFGRVVAVDDVDLDLPAGSVFGMLGPNGSGKTTLIRMLLGLTRPTAGTVELLGRTSGAGDLAAALPDVGAQIGRAHV